LKPPGKLSSVILWSVISAAFIGPGTVTTAVSAGSLFNLELLWAVVFATLACILLQEISARIVIGSGLNLGQTFIKKFGTSRGRWLQVIIGGSVVLGCAAYEAGNILGAVAGLNLITGINTTVLTIIISLMVLIILWIGGLTWISNLMVALVGIMGLTFFILALTTNFSVVEILQASITPALPASSGLLALGLVGTTIVPYNIFIGSGISKGQTVPLMRVGLTISVLIGGFITAAILIAGTTIQDFSSFPALASSFENKLGRPGFYALALGLFAAGFSSAITSPYASSVIARTVFQFEQEKKVKWVWGVVLLTGFFFGVSGIKPIPVILTVQALNGLILPLLVVFLVIIINDSNIIPAEHRHRSWYNVVLLSILFVVLVIGLNQMDKALDVIFNTGSNLPISFAITSGVVVYVAFVLWRMSTSNRTTTSA
jgi:Mn2+/Fe2+ NRAMP family transporter